MILIFESCWRPAAIPILDRHAAVADDHSPIACAQGELRAWSRAAGRLNNCAFPAVSALLRRGTPIKVCLSLDLPSHGR